MQAAAPNGFPNGGPKEYFAQLVEMMELYGISCVLAGTPVEQDINLYITENAGINATGNLSVRQLYVLARDALFAVSNGLCAHASVFPDRDSRIRLVWTDQLQLEPWL